MTQVFTVREAAQYLRLSESTLNSWRSNRRVSLPFVRIGDCVRYRQEDLDRWLEEHLTIAEDADNA
jgi:excisionase family DNA binding protein